MRRAIRQSLVGLATALDARHAGTVGHADRVGAWCGRLAVALDLPGADVEGLYYVGRLHDIGTVALSEAVLLKRRPLTPEEWAHVRRHPVVGAQILAPFDFCAAAALAIRHHHERWDGSGYPDGLRGEAIPLAARVVAVADVFDALVSARPYRPAWSMDDALTHLEAEAGRALDPALVAALVDLVRHRR
ncbi:MAG TPA: HD domain-containing phosphohydrolase [Candidatus Tectomicrobia bacterium]|nr:HD domain-containing phosphohydrolase [Candidatus Tectomicrobia bacterium]